MMLNLIELDKGLRLELKQNKVLFIIHINSIVYERRRCVVGG